MNTKELIEFAEKFFGDSISIMKKKNSDYTGAKEGKSHVNAKRVLRFSKKNI